MHSPSLSLASVSHVLVRLIGWPATVLHGDPAVFDRWRWLRRHLQAGPLRTLDAGSGSGAFTMYAAKLGNEAVGISYDERCNRVARERARILGLRSIEFVDGDLRELERWSNELGTFDQIICFETIEHIRDDRKLVTDLAALLKPGGRLLLTTPHIDHRALVGDAELSEEEDGGHIRRGYGFDEMRLLLLAGGFEVVSAEPIYGFASQQLINLMRLVARLNGRLAWVLVFPLRVIQPIDRPLTNLLRYPFLGIGVVAVRKEET